ncbi:MAG: CvpA family protein [Firmicutes bacterium]|nr:CvpA family protein [Bacillota bacterium]
MVMDILVLVIFVLVIFLTMRRGFVMSVVNFCKGLVSLVIGGIFCDNLSQWIMTKTKIGQFTIKSINNSVSSKWESSDLYTAMPDFLKDESGTLAASIIAESSKKLGTVLITILSFALIVFALRLVLSLIGRLFSHKNNKGFAGAVDWVLGFILGAILGIIFVFLFLALMVPILGLFLPEQCELVMGWLEDSFVAGRLYHNNLLLLLFRGLMG